MEGAPLGRIARALALGLAALACAAAPAGAHPTERAGGAFAWPPEPWIEPGPYLKRVEQGNLWPHLPPSAENVELVGRGQAGGYHATADLAALGAYAYLGTQGCGRKISVFDVSDPAAPQPAGEIDVPGAETMEGIQAMHVRTAAYEGDLLIHADQGCGADPVNGVSLLDVTDPHDPRTLARGAGDGKPAHSTFAWQAGDRLYVALMQFGQDDRDLDILDATDPRHPVLVSESATADWQQEPDPPQTAGAMAHDAWVRQIEGRWIMLLADWDGSYLKLDVTVPAKPRYLARFHYPDPDPVYGREPEMNAHHATFDLAGKLVLASDEDMSGASGHYHELVPEQVPRPPGLQYPAPEHIHFRGWGYMHLIDAETMAELDSYAIAEAQDPDYATGFGVLSVHEAKVDPLEPGLAYVAYYGGGLRVIRFDRSGIREAGHYIGQWGQLGENASDLWGVVPVAIGGQRYVLAADRSSGLWVFRFTG